MLTATGLMLLCVSAQVVDLGKGKDKSPADPFQKRVNGAIDRAVEWLRVRGVRPNTHRNGDLTTLALRHAGLKSNEQFYKNCRGATLRRTPGYTYNVGIQALLMENVDVREHQGELAKLARFLADSQKRNGQWSYTGRQLLRVGQVKRTGLGLGRRKGSLPLTGKKDGEPPPLDLVKLAPAPPQKDLRLGDNSNTHFAVLGLWAAERANVIVPKPTWRRVEKWLNKTQNDDGGWGYDDAGKKKNSTGTMTAAGALGLIAAKHFGGTPWKSDGRVQRGIDWARKNFTPSENPMGEKRWHYYYLWAMVRLERVMGKNRWYEPIARWLVNNQEEDGSWPTKIPTMESTNASFAILCLRRASIKLEIPPRPRDPSATPPLDPKPKPDVASGKKEKKK